MIPINVIYYLYCWLKIDTHNIATHISSTIKNEGFFLETWKNIGGKKNFTRNSNELVTIIKNKV